MSGNKITRFLEQTFSGERVYPMTADIPVNSELSEKITVSIPEIENLIPQFSLKLKILKTKEFTFEL